MGNSGFYLQDNQNTIFADNIRLGQMTNVLKKDELIIGTDTTPTVTKLSGGEGIVVTVDSTTIPSNTTFSLDIEAVIKEVTDRILNKIENELVKDIIKNITQSLINDVVDEVIKQIQINPVFPLSRAFKDVSISESIQCNGLFTKENVQGLDGGTEIAQFSVTPDNSESMFLICANIIATRMEGAIALALVKEGDKSPCAISYGYSSGYPNVVSLRAVVSNTTTVPVKFSLRAGGVDSGVVWINAMPNGEKILGVESISKITILEVKQQTNG